MSHFFNTSRDCASATFLGRLFQCLNHSSSEEVFPNTQSEPPLVQLQSVLLCPATSQLGEEADPQPWSALATASFHVVVKSDKVSLETFSSL